jgi:hypothetical protein
MAGGWNLLNQAGLPVMLECQRSNVAVHVAGIFNTVRSKRARKRPLSTQSYLD